MIAGYFTPLFIYLAVLRQVFTSIQQSTPIRKIFRNFLLIHWHFPNFPVLRNKENFLKNFSQNSVKNALCGVVDNERTFKRVWDSSQQAKSVRQAIAQTGRFTEMGTHFLGSVATLPENGLPRPPPGRVRFRLLG